MASNIRIAMPSDAAAVLEIYGPFCEDSPITFETQRPTLAEMEGRIRDITERFPWLVCDNGTDVLGYAYAGSHRERRAYRWSVDVAVYIADGYRGCGRTFSDQRGDTSRRLSRRHQGSGSFASALKKGYRNAWMHFHQGSVKVACLIGAQTRL